MNSDKLENLKREYLKTKTPPYLVAHGWEDLAPKLASDPRERFLFRPALSIGLALFIFVIAGTTLVFASQSSKPGENLYPVKILSDKVYSEVTGDYEATIDKRAEELIELKDEPNGSLDEATKQYQEAIEKAKDEKKDSEEEEKEKFRQKLEEKEKRFQEISQENSRNKNKFREIVEQTRRTRGEVKGEKKDVEDHENREEERNQSNKNEHKQKDND